MGWYERLGQWSETHRFGVDLTVTLLAAPFVIVGSAAISSSTYDYAIGGSALWAALLLVPLPWRRTRPVPSVIAVFAVGLLHLLAGYTIVFPADAVLLVSLFSVTVYGPRWAHVTAISSGLLGGLVLGIAEALRFRQSGMTATNFAMSVGLTTTMTGLTFLAVWAFGLVRRSRRETLTALRDRAERLEVERDQQARIAAAGERARIAREMHDIVAHSLSVIIAQADGGRYAGANDPTAATNALATVSETGRAALADMRRLLGVLRTEGPPGSTAGGPPGSRAGSPTSQGGGGRGAGAGGGAGVGAAGGRAAYRTGAGPGGPAADAGGLGPDRAPQPQSGDLEALVAQVRDSGLRVSLVRTGTARPLPPGAGLTVYRVCQEALTNVLKHAGPDPSVTVAVQWGYDVLSLEVIDDGRGAAANGGQGSGYGLLGMRERAALFGGTVSAGPGRAGGYRVAFRMPIPAPRPADTVWTPGEGTAAVGGTIDGTSRKPGADPGGDAPASGMMTAGPHPTEPPSPPSDRTP